ncbi:MAG: hypothetical protein AAF939_08570 [Planctomycetota bacterium]
MIHEILEIGPHVTAMPVIHGRGDFAWEVRKIMIQHQFDCVAVPIPYSFQQEVQAACLQLPVPSIVIQREDSAYRSPWVPESEERDSDNESDAKAASYVPIDPCQPVIAAIRTAMGEHIPCKFIDLETQNYQPNAQILPDAYALKKIAVQKFAAALVPHMSPPTHNDQWKDRINYMAWRLRELSVDYKKILFVTNILDWPWIRQAFQDSNLVCPEHESVHDPVHHQVDNDTLYFLLGELPFITGLYERARQELENDDNLSIDGIKELLICARDEYVAEFGNRARKITPKLLSQILKYTRNLTLIESCLTPQLIDIITASKQVAGDGYALHVLEKSKQYPYLPEFESDSIRMSIDRAAFPDGQIYSMVNRLPGTPRIYRNIELTPRPDDRQVKDWQQKWNPYKQCSWPPEDEIIENFRSTVFDRALETMGADLVQTEKFTTSIKDGIDIRETVRHWYDGEIHVKVLPPNQGKLDCAVILFDSPAEPREYPWRTTWFAEHKNESTLAFFATDFSDQPVGPGICLATYGGAMFLFPPVAISDIWSDKRLEFATTLEEQILGAACLHSQCPHIALVSSAPPGQAWNQIAKKFGKKFVHLPLSRFSDSTVQQLRMVHVLNGHEVRSYAADFIRKV